MAEPTERDRELRRRILNSLDPLPRNLGEALAPAIDHALARAREEGRQESKNLAEAERTYHDAHVVMKQRRHGDRDGEVSYYAVGPARQTLDEAELDLSAWRMRDA